MSFSGFGFGYGPFGHFPFGRADYGNDTVVRSFPATYIESPVTGEINETLKHYLCIAKEEVNKRKREIDALEDQIDPNTIRSDILRFLGTTLAVDVDEYEPEEFRRSLVNNSIVYYRIKGTKQSFTVRGRISGYEVNINNIYRINEDMHIRSTVGYVLPFVGSGDVSQVFAGTLVTFPLIKNSVKFKTNGTLFAEDDGTGQIITVSGSGYVISLGTIDYETGDYTFTSTPAPAFGEVITVDLESGKEDFLVAMGNGSNASFVSNLLPYPLFPTTLDLYIDGIHIGEDDGNGILQSISGSGYTVSGSINYRTGILNVTTTPPVPLGSSLTANFDKTLLAEFLWCHSDDIYEIPAGSNHWYVTIPPSLVAGNLSESCDYCLTTFIKILITVLKPIPVQASSENFFDRLIRKLKDVTPIHVRDLLYELRLVIVVDENQYLNVGSRLQEEHQWLIHSGFHRFDVVPADIVACDLNGIVKGTVEQI